MLSQLKESAARRRFFIVGSRFSWPKYGDLNLILLVQNPLTENNLVQ